MGKDFLNYEGWTATNFEVGAGVITVDAVIESAPAGCLSCGRLAICLGKHGPKEREIADIPVRGARVVIRLKLQRYICSNCGTTTFQPLLGITGTKRLTDRLASYVATKAVTEPFAKVAKETGLSPKKIRTVFVEFAARELKSRNIETPYSLGIDDVYVDRVARCVLVDNDTNGLYDLLPRRNMTFLNRFLLRIPNRHQVKVVTIDMCAPFRDAIRNALPDAIVVVDRFHIQRFANEAAKKVARSLRRRRKSGTKHNRDPFLLLRASDNLSGKTKADRDRWMEEEPLVLQAYQLKEAFLSLWKVRDRKQAEEDYDQWLLQVPVDLKEAFRELTTAMKNWRVQVFNYWDHRYTNATCESHNRIIKDIQRQGQSYDFETVRAKALLRDSQRQGELKSAVNAEPTPADLNEIRSRTQGSRTVSNTTATTKESRGQVGFNTKILDPALFVFDIRSDWASIKVQRMRDVLLAKFTQHQDLAERLLATGSAALIEESKMDAFWGTGAKGKGRNMLGTLLVDVRAEIKLLPSLPLNS